MSKKHILIGIAVIIVLVVAGVATGYIDIGSVGSVDVPDGTGG